MRKIVIIYICILILWLIGFILNTSNNYITIKYEIENINDDAIVDKIYRLSDTYLVLSVILFIVSFIFGVVVLTKSNNKKEIP